MKNKTLGLISMLALMAGTSQAAITWDGGGGDSLWATPANWDTNNIPNGSDDVVVGSPAAVTEATNFFSTLEIQSGASVTMVANSVSTNTIKVAGTLNRAGVHRLSGTKIELTATGKLGAGITFLDTNNGTMTFTNGAAFANASMDFEHKGTNVFNYTLDPSGFTTLVARNLFSGNNGSGPATWSNVTYNIDVSNYNVSNGTVVTLADYTSSNITGNFATDATVNIIAGGSGLNPKVTFNTSTSSLIVKFPKIWDGGAAGSWATATNWNGDLLPIAADEVIVGSSAAVTDGANTFSSLEIQAGASVTMVADSTASNTIKVAGTLNREGVHRLSGAKVELTGTGSIGSGVTFLDTNNGTMSFSSGASFGNPNMPFEHKGTNTFNYTLSPAGFTTMIAGTLRDGAGAVWANATYNIDISAYNISNGDSITLVDYSGHTPAMGGTFDPAVNIIAGGSGLTGILSFDTTTSKLVLTIPTGSAYNAWASLKGVTGGKLDDDDKDSLKNLEEYAWGTEPGVPNGNPIAVSTNGSGHLEISATKGAEAGADASITYVVKASFDLVNWTTTGVTTTTNNATNLLASYTGPPAPPAGKVFLRVFITNE